MLVFVHMFRSRGGNLTHKLYSKTCKKNRSDSPSYHIYIYLISYSQYKQSQYNMRLLFGLWVCWRIYGTKAVDANRRRNITQCRSRWVLTCIRQHCRSIHMIHVYVSTDVPQTMAAVPPEYAMAQQPFECHWLWLMCHWQWLPYFCCMAVIPPTKAAVY